MVKMINFMSCIFYYNKKKKNKLEVLALSSCTASGQAFLIQVPEEPPRGQVRAEGMVGWSCSTAVPVKQAGLFCRFCFSLGLSINAWLTGKPSL